MPNQSRNEEKIHNCLVTNRKKVTKRRINKMNNLDMSVFDGKPEEIEVACVDYDGLLKFGTNVRNLRYTWASERWRGQIS